MHGMSTALDYSTLTRGRGRPSAKVQAMISCELSEDDLLELENTNQRTKLQKISDRHHQAAKYIARGMGTDVTAALIGWGPQNVTVLLGDPSFKELVKLYQTQESAEFAPILEMLSGLSRDAVLRLREKLEDGEEIPISQLIEIVKMSADRTGAGPSSKQEVSVNIGLADRLESARKRFAQIGTSEQEIVDITPEAD